MEKQRRLPELRFPEFGEIWKRHNLGEIAKFSKGKGISKSEINIDGQIECIRYGELYTTYGEIINEVKSRTNINKQELVLSESNDVIIPASGETQIDIATASCVLKSGIALGGDLNIIKTVNNGIFLSYYLNSKKKYEIASLSQGIAVVHLYANQLALLELNLPTLPEQTKIASFFTAIDQKLTLLKKKKSLLEQYKKGVMQRIFCLNCDSYDYDDDNDFENHNSESRQSYKSKKSQFRQLRFKDENGNEFPEWGNKKLGEITFKFSRVNKDKHNYPVFSISNKYGFIPQNQQFEDLDSEKRGYDISLYKIVEKNVFAYNPARINVGSIGYSGSINNVIISSLYVCFKTVNEINDYFLLYFFNTNHFKRSVLKKTEGGVRDYLFYDNFSSIKISTPHYSEQTKIANFLTVIDDKINLCQQQIEKTELWKKGLMQKMFC